MISGWWGFLRFSAALQVESHSGRCPPGSEAGVGSQPGRGARDGRVPAHRLPQRGAVLGDGVQRRGKRVAETSCGGSKGGANYLLNYRKYDNFTKKHAHS